MTSKNPMDWPKKNNLPKNTRISDKDKENMVSYVQASLNMGAQSREQLIEFLADKYNRSGRQIERYLATHPEPKQAISNEEIFKGRSTVGNLSPHQKQLLYFGLRYRDRLYEKIPLKLAYLAIAGCDSLDVDDPLHEVTRGPQPFGPPKQQYDSGIMPLWHRPKKPVTQDDEEEWVEQNWGHATRVEQPEFDARIHPIYASFRQHGCEEGGYCVSYIEELYLGFLVRCLEAYNAIKQELKPFSNRMSEQGLQRIAKRIYRDGIAWANSNNDFKSTIENKRLPGRIVGPDGLEYYPMVEAHMNHNIFAPDANPSLSDVEDHLIAHMASHEKMLEVFRSKNAAEHRLGEFRRRMYPDSRLIKRILSGFCDACERPILINSGVSNQV